ncbi:hypothetical protein IDH44_06595 [Paenibacillus sp. IB182496]|uniref:Peptidylprolyl isomerase n=1 Tax=Paenibacillus sabuli TaxID=2772509 RepID=A0A927BSG8_9BACL|nr:hypothetical protein [Paenibacillus sabuli]MBD2844855.1 hypothetical protein [Paenibacillus sabuli]
MNRRRRWILAAVATVALAGIGLAALLGGLRMGGASGGVADDEVVARLDGGPITAAELRRTLDRQHALVAGQARRTAGAAGGVDDWATAGADGVTPAETAKRLALEAAVRLRVQLRLARTEGLIATDTYAALQEERARENARRAAALAAGQPVYGPERFEARAFADFYVGRLNAALLERLAAREPAGEAQLRAHYERIKEPLFRREGEVRFTAYRLSYREGGRETDARRRQAEAAMQTLRQQLESGAPAAAALEAAMGEAPADAPRVLATEEQFDDRTARTYYKALPQLYELLTDAPEAGQVLPVVDDPQQGAYVLAVVDEALPGGYDSFEAQRDNVRQHYWQTRLEALWEQMAADADVSTNEAYARLDADGGA